MSAKSIKIDHLDTLILDVMQRDGSLTQREVADAVGLSQNACWRRVQRLIREGVLCGSRARIDARRVGLDLTVFMMVRTRHHARDWAEQFRRHVEAIPEVAEFHRIGGEWDYLLKVVTSSMAGYDRVYQQLIASLDLENVTGYFSMETILEDRPLRVRATV
jgi:Lrp/AsnC family transcriptional regulator